LALLLIASPPSSLMERSITEGRQDRAAAMSGPSTGVARTFFWGGG